MLQEFISQYLDIFCRLPYKLVLKRMRERLTSRLYPDSARFIMIDPISSLMDKSFIERCIAFTSSNDQIVFRGVQNPKRFLCIVGKSRISNDSFSIVRFVESVMTSRVEEEG
jgi:hypothetical protein